MIHKITLIKLKFNGISLRERFTVSLCVIIGLYFILDFFLLQKNIIKKDGYDIRIKTAKEEIQLLTNKQEELLKEISNSPKIKNKEKLEKLKILLEDKNVYIKSIDSHVVNSQDVDSILSDVYGLLEGIKVNNFNLSDVKNISEDNDEIKSQIYKYSFNIVMSGSYFEILEKIKLVELSGLNVYFDELSYKVDVYPKATVDLHAFILMSNYTNDLPSVLSSESINNESK